MPDLDWGKMTLCGALDETAEKFPDREAIVFGDRRITYRELHQNVRRLAKSLLKAGVKKGDKVAIMMTNLPEWIMPAMPRSRSAPGGFLSIPAIKLRSWNSFSAIQKPIR